MRGTFRSWVMRPSPSPRDSPGFIPWSGSNRRTVSPWTCSTRTALCKSISKACDKRWRFSWTQTGSSPTFWLILSERVAPRLTPPRRVEMACFKTLESAKRGKLRVTTPPRSVCRASAPSLPVVNASLHDAAVRQNPARYGLGDLVPPKGVHELHFLGFIADKSRLHQDGRHIHLAQHVKRRVLDALDMLFHPVPYIPVHFDRQCVASLVITPMVEIGQD